MQEVSKAYKESMKSLLRERSYMMISFGLINHEAQTSASVEGSDYTYYSNIDIANVVKKSDTYATFEENFTTVDGTQFFVPREGEYLDTGLTSKNILEDEYRLKVTFDNIYSLKGLTIEFGEVYPIDFDVITEEGTFEVRGNDQQTYITEETFDDVSYFEFVFYRMSIPNTRVRIYSLMFGYGLLYYNNDIMDTSLETYISPISSDVSQTDFKVKLQNFNKYFNVDNPESAINYLATGQEMQVYYGYDIDNMEWLKGGKFVCSSWETDDTTVTINCTDKLRTLGNEYYKGAYYKDGITLYDLAEDVFQDADVEDYKIDEYLKKVRTKNPLPRVTHREALQIIANAGRSVLCEDREGTIRITASFKPDWIVTSTDEADYSNTANVADSNEKEHYATYATDYAVLDGSFLFKGSGANTGYVSKSMSDKNGDFEDNPIIVISMESEYTCYGMYITFGDVLPGEFIVHVYNGETEKNTITVHDIGQVTYIENTLKDFNVLKIEFAKTHKPYNNIVVDNIKLGDMTDFTMERNDMMSSPKTTKQEQISCVNVVCYTYTTGNAETLVSEELTAVEGEALVFYFDNAVINLSATFEGEKIDILSQGAYYCTLQFDVSGTGVLEIIGNKLNITTKTYTETLNAQGKAVTWENPLVSDMEIASNLAEWLGAYYDANVEYEYDTRGNPELDANDIIYQENDFCDNYKVRVYRHTVNFKQALSGYVVARKYVEEA